MAPPAGLLPSHPSVCRLRCWSAVGVRQLLERCSAARSKPARAAAAVRSSAALILSLIHI
eukprot:3101533-Prymnesium_polylepis.1